MPIVQETVLSLNWSGSSIISWHSLPLTAIDLFFSFTAKYNKQKILDCAMLSQFSYHIKIKLKNFCFMVYIAITIWITWNFTSRITKRLYFVPTIIPSSSFPKKYCTIPFPWSPEIMWFGINLTLKACF